MSYSEKISEFIQDVNCFALDRNDAVKGVLLALLTKQHCFIYGEPGLAKSMTARLILNNVTNAELFIKQITRQMTEEAVFGPLDIPAWRNEGVYKFHTKGGLAEADLALLEEYFDGSDALTRSMNEVLNEREFSRSLDSVIKCPLHTCVATSNYFRQDGDAQAVADRFLIRIAVNKLSHATRRKMIDSALKSGSAPKVRTQGHLDFKKIKDVHKVLHMVQVSDKLLDAYNNLVHELRIQFGNKLYLSDRRIAWAANLMQASAYLSNKSEADFSDLRITKFGLILVGDDFQENCFSQAIKSVEEPETSLEHKNFSVSALQKMINELKANKHRFDADKRERVLRELNQILDGVMYQNTKTTDKQLAATYSVLYEEIKNIYQELQCI